MTDWIDSLKNALSRAPSAVVITVIAVEGSVPREVGATIVVTVDRTFGTIGGGNLEFSAIATAREMLVGQNESAIGRSVEGEQACQQISLGPSLGQCCGGRVELLFECVTGKTQWVKELTVGHGLSVETLSESRSWLCRNLDHRQVVIESLEDFQQQVSIVANDALTTEPVLFNSSNGTSRWFCMPVFKIQPAVYVYGAGHVGQAVVAQLNLLSCRVIWIDHREGWLQLQPDLPLDRVLTDSPEDEVHTAAADAYHVVMTHSHAVDFEICHAVLKHRRFGWLGLIGSETKRRTFIKRLQQRGIDDELISRLRCPIGNLHLESSVPSVIALSLAAELASLWEGIENGSSMVGARPRSGE